VAIENDIEGSKAWLDEKSPSADLISHHRVRYLMILTGFLDPSGLGYSCFEHDHRIGSVKSNYRGNVDKDHQGLDDNKSSGRDGDASLDDNKSSGRDGDASLDDSRSGGRGEDESLDESLDDRKGNTENETPNDDGNRDTDDSSNEEEKGMRPSEEDESSGSEFDRLWMAKSKKGSGLDDNKSDDRGEDESLDESLDDRKGYTENETPNDDGNRDTDDSSNEEEKGMRPSEEDESSGSEFGGFGMAKSKKGPSHTSSSPTTWNPELHYQFSSLSAAMLWIEKWAAEVGFKVRKGKSKPNDNLPSGKYLSIPVACSFTKKCAEN
ncbi:hypothetical protein BGW38_007945, partial [Lunasporangiospora selenospora]